MIEVEAKLLRAGAAEAAAVAATRAEGAPILGNVLIEAGPGGGKMRLCATDMDLVIDRYVPLISGTAMKFTVSARLLKDIAAKLPPEATVALKLEQDRLIVTAGRSRFALATLPPDQFPEFTAETWAAEFEMEAADLGRMLQSVAFAISTEETRYYLNGVFLHAARELGDEGEMLMRAATTDGYRLARFQLPLPDGAATLPEKGVIVARRAVKVIRDLLGHLPVPAAGEAGPKIDLAISANRLRADFGETVLTAKMIDGQFPDYSRVIPSANPNRRRIDKAALREAAERVSTIASDKTRVVKMELGNDVATLSTVSELNGSASEEVAADYAAEALTIGFNSRYLIEVLDQIDGDVVEAELGNAAAPVLLRDPDCGQKLFVLMPTRVA